jgi:hypothetical protein
VVSEEHRGQGAAGHAPLAEAGRREDVRGGSP